MGVLNKSWWPDEFRYTLAYQGVTKVLEHIPEGWEDFSLEWKMDKRYWGRTITLGLPTKFTRDGKEIVDRAYANDGVNAVVMYRMEQFDYTTGVWAYQTIYENKLDFTSIVIERDFTEIAAMPQGLMTLLASKEGQEYEIDMDGATTVNYDRLALNQSFSINSIWLKGHFTENYYFTPDLIVDNERELVSINGKDVVEFQSVPFFNANLDNIINKGVWLFKSNANIQNFILNLKSKYYYMRVDTPNPPADTRLIIFRYDGVNTEEVWRSVNLGWYLVYHSEILGDQWRMDLSVSAVFNVAKGFRYYAVFYCSDMNVILPQAGSSDNYYSLSEFKYRGVVKNIQVITPTQLGTRLLQKLANGINSAFAPIDNNVVNQYFGVTSGDVIRGTSGAKIKTSFADFFDTYARLFQLGMDITRDNSGVETARIMPLSYFFQDVEIMNLGEVIGLQIRPWKEKLYNSVTVGQDDKNYDNSGGKGEFNTQVEMSTATGSTNSKNGLKSSYRYDSYGVEYTLIDFEDRGTSDSASDNDVFVIKHTGNNGGVDRSILIAGTYADSTMFNAALSPKQTLIRNQNLLASCLDKVQKNIVFTSSKKDDVTPGGTYINGIKERSDLSVDGALQYFRPMLFMFETGLKNFNAYKLLSAPGSNPNGYFRFTFRGKSYKGFLYDLKIKPAENRAQEWQLICHPQTSIQ